MSAASDSYRRLWHLWVLYVAELTKALLTLYRNWSKTVFVRAHRQRITFLLYRLLLDSILIK